MVVQARGPAEYEGIARPEPDARCRIPAPGAAELEETLLMELSSESVLFQQLPPALPGPTPIAALTAADDVASSVPSTINPSGDVPCPTS